MDTKCKYNFKLIFQGAKDFMEERTFFKLLVSDQQEIGPFPWGKVFKNGPSKTCGRHPLTYLQGCGPL